MSFWTDIFSSPRAEAGKDIYKQAGDLRSSFGGINNMGDVQKTFGLQPFDINQYRSDVGATYQPARRNLASRLAQSLSRGSARMSSSNATPEMTFSGIEGAYAPEFGNLEQGQAEQNLQGLDKQRQSQQFNADFLRQILGGKDQFGINKLGVQSNAMQGLSGSSTFGDILGGLGTAAMAAGGLGWNPFAKKAG